MLGELIHLGNDNSDRYLDQRKYQLHGYDWKFLNSTDLRIKLFVKKPTGERVQLITTLEPNGLEDVSKSLVKEGDIIYATTPQRDGDKLIFTPFKVRGEWKTIEIGAVRFDTDGDQQTSKLYSPISQVKISNEYIFPIDVYHNKRKVMSLGGEDGKGYFARSRSIGVYTGNSEGLKEGDMIEFCVRGTRKVVGMIRLDYTFAKSIKVGFADAYVF